MFNLKNFLQIPDPDKPVDKKSLEKKIQIATCALFLEIANSDEHFSEEERSTIIEILNNEFSLSEDEVHALIEKSEHTLDESIDLWQFTNLINQNFSDEDKIKILENLWRIIYADEKLDAHEDYLAHKIANLLRLPHKTLIETKLKVNKHEKRD
ncbi:hypothetical protein D4R71_09035 [bacterium]|nr:MAG: hypothetical protein D4R71_09035 [bacterium]